MKRRQTASPVRCSKADFAACTGNKFFFRHTRRHLDQFQTMFGYIEYAQISDDTVDNADTSEWQVAVLE
jgi:hypothetical protein